MKTTLFLFLFLTSGFLELCAQVTVGDNIAPQKYSILEVSAESAAGGLRLPQLTRRQRNDLALAALTDPTAIIRAKGLTIYNTDDDVIEFWDGESWVKAKAVEPWKISGTNNTATLNTQNIYQMGSVGIGTSVTNSSAVLHVDAVNKGVLLPKVALVSNKDQNTIANPAIGLLVYNTGTGGLSIQGYVYWDGIEWRKFNSGTTKSPTITGLQCSNARISPAVFRAGEAYNGVMTIPYSGGNGGAYPTGDEIYSIGNTGLTAILQEGELKHGNGELVYTLTGVPKYSSPVAANFVINLLGYSCYASVSGTVLGVGEMLTFSGVIPASLSDGTLLSSYYPTQLPVMDGLRMDLAYNTKTYYRPRVYNVSSSSQQVSYQTFATQVNENRTELNVELAPNDFAKIDNNDIVYWTTTAAEVITTNLQVQIGPGVWRWYEMKWWAMEIKNSNQKTIFMSVIRKA